LARSPFAIVFRHSASCSKRAAKAFAPKLAPGPAGRQIYVPFPPINGPPLKTIGGHQPPKRDPGFKHHCAVRELDHIALATIAWWAPRSNGSTKLAVQGGVGRRMDWPNGNTCPPSSLTYERCCGAGRNSRPSADFPASRFLRWIERHVLPQPMCEQVDVGDGGKSGRPASGHEWPIHTLNHPCLAGTFDMAPAPAVGTITHARVRCLQEIGQPKCPADGPWMDGRSMAFAVPCGQTLAGGQGLSRAAAPVRKLVTYSRSVVRDRR